MDEEFIMDFDPDRYKKKDQALFDTRGRKIRQIGQSTHNVIQTKEPPL
jgi:hypothetical protein